MKVKSAKYTRRYMRIMITAVILWTGAICLSIYSNLKNEREEIVYAAQSTAEAFFEDIVTTRLWNSMHGGVYVPVTGTTEPNPYLEDPQRDVTTTDGVKLTKINPAYMTRQISEINADKSKVMFHLTSLKPIRPENKPTDWERKALTAFEKEGKDSLVEIEGSGENETLNYMAPLMVEEPCLKCHEKQGYKLGDVRGGIRVSVPILGYRTAHAGSFSLMWKFHIIIWLTGLAAIFYSVNNFRKNFMAMIENEELLRTTFAGLGAGVMVVDEHRIVKLCNRQAEEMTGLSQREIVGYPIDEIVKIVKEKSGGPVISPVDTAFLTGSETRCESTDELLVRTDGSRVPVSYIVNPIRDRNNSVIGVTAVFYDISQITKAEKDLALAAQILDRLNSTHLNKTVIREIISSLKNFADVENVGIRMIDGAEYPFLTSIGLSEDFLEVENKICSTTPEGAIRTEGGNPVMDCFCGQVIKKKTDPSIPCYTENGSFFSSELHALKHFSPEEMRAINFRGRCPKEGFKSLALVPLKSGDAVIGLLYMSDRQPGKFSQDTIRFIEGIGAGIGIALQRIEDEQAVKNSEKRFRALIDNGLDIIAIASPDGTILYQSENMKRILGYSHGEAVGIGSADLVHPDDMRLFENSLKECVARAGKPITIEYRCRHKNGDWRIVQSTHTNMAHDPAIGGIIINARDITDRRKAEAALAREIEVTGAIAELSQSMLSPACLDEISFKILEIAKKLTGSRFGYVGHIDPETGSLVSSTMTRDIWDICKVKNKEAVFDKFCGLWGWVLTNRESLYSNNPFEDPRSSGTPEGHIPIENFISAPALAGKELLGQISLANCEDGYTDDDMSTVNRLADLYTLAIMSERARTAILDSEARLRTITDSTRDAILMTDEQDRISFWNPAAEKMFALPAGEAMGKTPWDCMLAESDKEAFATAMTGVREGEITGPRGNILDFTALRSNGESISAAVTMSPIRTENSAGVVLVVRDVTERKRTEDAMRFIAEGTATETGSEFFYSLAKNLAAALHVKYALVTECMDWPPKKVRTLSLWTGESFGDNIEYSLSGTPCDNVFIDGEVCFYSSDIQEQFPEDHILKDMGAESYIGAPIVDSSGNLLGNIAVLDDRPFPANFSMAPIIKIFAARAGAELERLRAVKELELHQENLKDIVAARTRELQSAIEDLHREINVRREAEKNLRALSKKTITMQEEERAHISRELHDDLGQRLTIMRLELDWLKTLSRENITPGHFDEMIEKVVDATKGLRLICQGLRPLILDDLGIGDAMEEMARDFGARPDMNITVSIAYIEKNEISPEAAICFFRVLQEALNNIAKHSGATEVEVSFSKEGREFVLTVEDNGRGISGEKGTGKVHLGIIGMKERASLCGGSLEIDSGKYGGVRLVMRAPQEQG